MKVLLLEDSRLDAHLVRQFFFRREEYNLTVVSTEADALTSLKDLHPDVFLVDVIIDGEAVHNLIELAAKRNLATSIIPLASAVAVDERRFYRALGCATVITKPFTWDDLTTAFENLRAVKTPAPASAH